MHWRRILLAIVVSGVGATLADWLFAGVLFHKKYLETPEIWRRPQGGGGETRAIVLTSVMTLFSCAVFVLMSAATDLNGYEDPLLAGLALWLIGVVPIYVTLALWMKYHPLLATTHALGWFVRLMLTAFVTGWLVTSRH